LYSYIIYKKETAKEMDMMNAMYTEDERMAIPSAVLISHMVSVILGRMAGTWHTTNFLETY